MQFLLWIVFLLVLGIAFFAVQNSGAPPIVIRFLIWRFETSLIYTILGSVGLGILITVLFWGYRAFRGSRKSRGGSPG